MSDNDPDYHSYLVGDGHGLRHDPFGALVAPRPIGWISTTDGAGRPNLAPYSFFNAFNYTPPIIGFASTGWKDSVRNIEATGEFVWNLASRPQAEAVNMSCIDAPHGTDEFALAGLSTRPARLVAPPLVAGAPAAMECRLTQLERLRDRNGAAIDTWLILGEVVAVHIDRALIRDDIVQTILADPLLRAGGNDYFGISDDMRQSLKRPRWAADGR